MCSNFNKVILLNASYSSVPLGGCADREHVHVLTRTSPDSDSPVWTLAVRIQRQIQHGQALDREYIVHLACGQGL